MRFLYFPMMAPSLTIYDTLLTCFTLFAAYLAYQVLMSEIPDRRYNGRAIM